MKLLGRRADDADDAEGSPTEESTQTPAGQTGTTAPKGRPTPKRSERNKPRGPVAPAPMTASEARQRRKQSLESMTKEERKAEKVARRVAMTQRRERMASGDEASLLPRDQGPIRRYARDIVDSRRNVLGLFMPAAFFLLFIMLAAPRLQLYMSPLMLLMTIAMMVDGLLLARKVNKCVDAKFPDNTETRFKLGMYAVSRATQLRRSRLPRPQVKRGAKVV
ncbi:MAG: DUF3043 domain-containing protein [Mycobacteriaceae bacterium]